MKLTILYISLFFALLMSNVAYAGLLEFFTDPTDCSVKQTGYKAIKNPIIYRGNDLSSGCYVKVETKKLKYCFLNGINNSKFCSIHHSSENGGYFFFHFEKTTNASCNFTCQFSE